jgi:hypothetical protein
MYPTDRRTFMIKVTQVFWLLFGLLEALIALRFMLKLMAANPANPFAVMVYGLSYMFVWPFLGLTVTPATAGIVLEIPSIIAMIVYALLAWALVQLFWILGDRPGQSTVVRETTVVEQPVPPQPQNQPRLR